MSGLISSLLIEPVVRRTRHLSYQTNAQPPSSNDHQGSSDSPPSTQHNQKTHGGNDSKQITMPDQTQEHNPGLGSGYAGSGNDPANSPTPTLDSDTSRHGRRTGAAFLEGVENGSEYVQATEYPVTSTSSGPVEFGQETAASTIPTQDVSRRRAPSNRQERRRSSRHASGTDEVGARFSLPEDDGMGVLRKRIHAIRDMPSTNTEKARMIHDLMTEKYNASRWNTGDQYVPGAHSPSSPRSPERPSTPMFQGDGQLFDQLSASPSSTVAPGQRNNPYNLAAEDLEPTFFPKDELDSPMFDGEDTDTDEFVEDVVLGCRHYKRNVKIQCFACKKWYTCRFCHDEVEDHHLIRHKTENMLCMMCGHAQPAAHFCEHCGELAAQYFCEVCKLWDNDSKKSIYHCTDCGICRIGQGLGKDFFHCKVRSIIRSIVSLETLFVLCMLNARLDMQCMPTYLDRKHPPLHRTVYSM